MPLPPSLSTRDGLPHHLPFWSSARHILRARRWWSVNWTAQCYKREQRLKGHAVSPHPRVSKSGGPGIGGVIAGFSFSRRRFCAQLILTGKSKWQSHSAAKRQSRLEPLKDLMRVFSRQNNHDFCASYMIQYISWKLVEVVKLSLPSLSQFISFRAVGSTTFTRLFPG